MPLHSGSCPKWLFSRMTALTGEISEIIVNEHSQDEFLRRISNPFFFQALGCLAGYDWHSSGLTTTLTAALKESLNKKDLGLKIAGGKGAASQKTPWEIEKFSSSFNLTENKIKRLIHASRISAKVDNAVLQDAYQLYHHAFVFTEKGKWAVIQQGMNENNQLARRYHWLSDLITDFVEEPHQAICGEKEKEVLDLTAKQSKETRKISLDLVKDNPGHLYSYFSKQTSLNEFFPKFKRLRMTARHWIKEIDLTENDRRILEKAYQLQPENYEELISLKGMGPKKIRALALISNLIYGSEISWRDPVKYSFGHGGKDGTPFPVDKQIYDHSIKFLKEVVNQTELKGKEGVLKKLNFFLKD